MLNDPKDFPSRTYSSVKTSLNISLDVTVEEKNPILNPGLKRQNLLRTLKIVLKITMMMLTTNCRSMIL
ncbi:Hypothetical predicted protein, partial [Olea europaea subsp. europaea]